MMSDDLQIAQIEHAAEHVGVAAGDRAFLGLQLDRAADLLVRRENVGRVVALARRQLQDLADDELDRRGERLSTTMTTRMSGATNSATRSE